MAWKDIITSWKLGSELLHWAINLGQQKWQPWTKGMLNEWYGSYKNILLQDMNESFQCKEYTAAVSIAHPYLFEFSQGNTLWSIFQLFKFPYD